MCAERIKHLHDNGGDKYIAWPLDIDDGILDPATCWREIRNRFEYAAQASTEFLKRSAFYQTNEIV